jgi:tRNA threonylcarbamoyladenosine biosynthesis protein TsaE
MKQQWEVNRVEDLPAVAWNVLQALGEHRKIVLYGEMGAGKTTFVKAFCAVLGVKGETASPTFSLINTYSYQTSDGVGGLVHHLDLYRLQTSEEALDIGIEDVLYDSHYCIIEWPQIMEAYLPPDCVKLQITLTADQSRLIQWME